MDERLNVSKTNLILFHSCKLKPNQSFSVEIEDAIIKQVDSAIYPSIYLSS